MIKKVFIAFIITTMLLTVSCKNNDKPLPPDNAGSGENTQNSDWGNPYNAENLKEFINQRYLQAKEAYFWFEVSSMPPQDGVVNANNIKEVDGFYYYKVGHDTIKTFSDLENYLKSIFSQEITQQLLSKDKSHYIDIDGELWAKDLTRGTNISAGNAIFSISEQSENKVVYTANVEQLDPENPEQVIGLKQYNYVYEKTNNGWRWTNFSIYQ